MRLKLLVTLLAVFLLLGCLGLGKPEIRGIKNYWGTVNESVTEIITDVTVYNPNPVPIPVKDVLTEVYVNQLKLGEGSALSAEIKPGESTILISTKIDNEKIPEWWMEHLKNNEKSKMRIKGYLVFDLKVTEFKYPIKEMTREIKTNLVNSIISASPGKFELGLMKIEIVPLKSEIKSVTAEKTEVEVSYSLKNSGKIPFKIKEINYTIKMNELKFAEGSKITEKEIGINELITINCTIYIENEKLKDWWVSHIKNKETTKIKMIQNVAVEILGMTHVIPIEKEVKMTTSILT